MRTEKSANLQRRRKPQLSHCRGHFHQIRLLVEIVLPVSTESALMWNFIQLKFNKPIGVQFPTLVDRLDPKSKCPLQCISDVDYLGNWTAMQCAHCPFTSLFFCHGMTGLAY
ncbi:hypothetical protein EXN66_Car012290 [Channa argus]|uniref:Uncharacterized protein n=1 Tax=Channa argus TaxID=215402 RepID=A0A6G1Q281_CHAAH|nr:hypothetical protein EXN66_Car012290 [Channa argus]